MKTPRLLVVGLCFAGLALHSSAQEQESSDKTSPDSPLKKPLFREHEEMRKGPPRPPGDMPMDREGPPIPPEMIEKFDLDKDGKLNFQEMKEARDSMREMNKDEVLKKFDKNGDGKLSDSEMEKLQKAREEDFKNQLIKEYDANGNGKLDSAEKKKILEDAKLQPMRFEWLNRPGPNPLKDLVK